MNYRDFAKTELATYNLEAFEIDQTKALESVLKELETTMEDLSKETTKQARLKHLQIEGVVAEDYTEHLISLDQHKKILCGIRHMGGNSEFPFVHTSTNFKVEEPELVEIYQTHLKEHFEKFKPNYIRYYKTEASENNEMGSCYLVQKASVIKSLKPHSEEANIELLLPEDDAYYEWYKEGYEKFHQAFPDLKPNVPINDKKMMEESRENGLLRIAHYQNQPIGLIAAEREDFLGAKGCYFIEIFIEENHKGKGLAKNIQRKFIDHFTEEEDLIWGTIEYQNKPSLKTALSNKRLPIRFENFIKIKPK